MSTAPGTVASVMTSRVVAATPATSFKRLVEAMAGYRINSLPVIDADTIVLGVVSESDLLTHLVRSRQLRPATRLRRLTARRHWAARPESVTAGELMTAPAVTSGPDEPVAEAAARALQAKVHRMPVVDQRGRLIGLVTRADLLKVYLRSDAQIREEIVQRVLKSEMALDPARFELTVEHGVVRLGGQVEWLGIESALVEQIRDVPGVISVQARLSSARESDERRPVGQR